MTGTYNAEITSLNFTNVLNALSVSPGSGAVTGSVSSGRGFANTAASLSGIVPGSGRYFFDGVGNIWGRQAGSSSTNNLNAVVGSYTIANDCTGSIVLSTGEHFNMVVTGYGATALFLQSDAGSGGTLGQLDRAVESCPIANTFPSNFGFTFFGARLTNGTDTSAGATPAFAAYAAIGAVRLLDNGDFRLQEWLYSAGTVQTVTSRGTFSVGADCNLQLTFAQNADLTSGTTGAVNFTAPATFRATLNRGAGNATASTGILVIQPSDLTVVMGRFISQ